MDCKILAEDPSLSLCVLIFIDSFGLDNRDESNIYVCEIYKLGTSKRMDFVNGFLSAIFLPKIQSLLKI